MNDQKLRELLEQLHAELASTESVDEKGREMLGRISADIQKLLEPSETSRASILAQLQDAIDHFEVEHPAITTALSQMLSALSNAGI
jgi:predicted component of type VI protein secretion system